MGPALAALAAGNRVLVKPSELTPRFSALLEQLVGAAFDPAELAVVNGDAETGKAFAALPFDHLFFTASTAVGRQVALAAAANLTPVTLELAPTLVIGAPGASRLLREEIFGPVLPIVEYTSVDDAIAYVNRGARPLALYWFGRDAEPRKRVLRETISGGVTVNDCLWHLAQEAQPFGGVGGSVSGAYHGEWGFRTFSKQKPCVPSGGVERHGALPATVRQDLRAAAGRVEAHHLMGGAAGAACHRAEKRRMIAGHGKAHGIPA